MDYYSVLKGDTIIPCDMDKNGGHLAKGNSYTQKEKYQMISFICAF